MYASMVGKMVCNELKRDYKVGARVRNFLDKFPSLTFVLVLLGVPIISMVMVFALTMLVMYPISVLVGWV